MKQKRARAKKKYEYKKSKQILSTNKKATYAKHG